jgi:transcriptional regulator with XRE-family HTH domain
MYEVIKLSNLSEADIGENLGVTRQFVHQWSSGKRPIPAKYKDKLYKILLNSLLASIEKQREGIKMLEKSVAIQVSKPQHLGKPNTIK